MSFALFKQNMLSYMGNQSGINSFSDFAKKLTDEYDMAVRRGFQTINQIPITKDNKQLMNTLVTLACSTALGVREGQHTFIDDIGKGVVGYWTVATLMTGIPPIIPATGAIQNVTTTSAFVTNPGQFPNVGPLITTLDSGVFLDKLIGAMQQHLTTIQGLYITISLYPGFPLVPPAPGIRSWTGFTIPPAGPSVPFEPPQSGNTLFEAVKKLGSSLLAGLIMSEEDKQEAQREADEADAVANDTSLPESGRTSAKEYSNLKKSEISSGERNSAPVDLTDDELKEIEESIPPEYKCEQGTKIVAIAKRDIGILETGTPPGKNYGGFPGGVQKNERGRIDDMFDNVGLDNQAKVRKDGSGYYWCAAAVATWWQEAGLETPSGGASCDNWMNWGKQKGYWSTKPKVGAAVLYGSASDAHHIGIVAAVTATGGIVTIEGNTSGGGFNRNGCGVFQKVPRRYLGFVNPPECS